MGCWGLAKRLKIKVLQASTSEVYGDPTVHPQPESDWGDPQQRRPNIDAAERFLGWRPRVPLKEGLQMTIAHFEKVVAEGKLER